MLHTKEHCELMKQFEQDYRHLRLDRETKDLWKRGQLYQNGEANNLFKAYERGYSLHKSISNIE